MPDKKSSNEKASLSNLILIIVSVLIIIVVLGGSLYIMINNNINGIADKNRDTIQKIPFFKNALPEFYNPEELKYMNDRQIIEKYIEYRDENIQLKKQIDEAKEIIESIEEEKQGYINEKEELDSRKQQLEEDISKFERLTVLNDTEGYKEFYEKIAPDMAKELYEEILVQEKNDKNAQELALYYEKMKPEAAARIFEQQGVPEISNISDLNEQLEKGSFS